MHWLRIALFLALSTLVGCGTHVAANPLLPKPWAELVWVDTYQESLERGIAEEKPVLLILAAGPRSGFT